jgi:hypothetical protein
LRAALRGFAHDTRGTVAFEAIWAVFILGVLLMVGFFLFQITKTGGSGPIDNRTAGRSAALNETCSPDGFVPGLMQTVGTRDDSMIFITCDPNVNGERRISEPDRFWNALIEIGNSHFDDFNERQDGHGDITAVLSEQRTLFTRDFAIGSNVLASNLSYSNEALTPMAETWRFDDEVWAEGHDAVIWDRLDEAQRRLFPRVYPSAR